MYKSCSLKRYMTELTDEDVFLMFKSAAYTSFPMTHSGFITERTIIRQTWSQGRL